MSAHLPPVCILAGGRGMRLGDRVLETPKPLLPVAGQPFLHHQLRLLKAHGGRRVVICVGYLGERIEAAIGAGDRFGLDVGYARDGPAPAGTAGAVRNALGLLGGRFLVLYGDTYLRIDYAAVAADLDRRSLPGIMTVLRNEGRWDTSNAEVDDTMVRRYDKRAPTAAMHWIDYGLGALTPTALDAAPDASDLADVYTALAAEGRLGAFEARERFYEIGTPEGLRETEAFLRDSVGG